MLILPFLCRFRKGYSTQYSLLRLINECKKSFDNKSVMGALLMDLSKTFDCLDHELLTAKLSDYGFDKDTLLIIHSFIGSRRQKVKMKDSFSTW